MKMIFFFFAPHFSKWTAVKWTGTAGMTGMWDNKSTWFPQGSSESEQRRGRNIACQSCDRASLHSRISLPQSLSLKCLLHWASGRNQSKMTAVRSRLMESSVDLHAATPEPSTWSQDTWLSWPSSLCQIHLTPDCFYFWKKKGFLEMPEE